MAELKLIEQATYTNVIQAKLKLYVNVQTYLFKYILKEHQLAEQPLGENAVIIESDLIDAINVNVQPHKNLFFATELTRTMTRLEVIMLSAMWFRHPK